VKTVQHPTRIDIVFVNVAAVKVRAEFPDLVVEECDAQSAEAIMSELGVHRADYLKVFRLTSSPLPDGFVVAAATSWHEDTGDAADSSHFGLPVQRFL
jgi:hypothetical protein